MKTSLEHRFVKYMPEVKEDGILYISLEYNLAIHNCICGCGNEVVTPLSPACWELKYNGETMSLSPSIGNWDFKCKTHYWIINNKICIAGQWSDSKIKRGKEREQFKIENYFKRRKK